MSWNRYRRHCRKGLGHFRLRGLLARQPFFAIRMLYRRPLNPNRESISWVIAESHAGLQNVRDMAAVPGIGVLRPGAGTLRQVFSMPGVDGEPVVDEVAWEAVIQKVLAASGFRTIEIGRQLRNASGARG